MSYKEIVTNTAYNVLDRKKCSINDAFAIELYKMPNDNKIRIIEHFIFLFSINNIFCFMLNKKKYYYRLISCIDLFKKDVYNEIYIIKKTSVPENINYSQSKIVKG